MDTGTRSAVNDRPHQKPEVEQREKDETITNDLLVKQILRDDYPNSLQIVFGLIDAGLNEDAETYNSLKQILDDEAAKRGGTPIKNFLEHCEQRDIVWSAGGNHHHQFSLAIRALDSGKITADLKTKIIAIDGLIEEMNRIYRTEITAASTAIAQKEILEKLREKYQSVISLAREATETTRGQTAAA